MFLLPEAYKRPEAQFDGFALGFGAGRLQGFLHQVVIDDNVRSHEIM
jgi:hypothetical protein